MTTIEFLGKVDSLWFMVLEFLRRRRTLGKAHTAATYWIYMDMEILGYGKTFDNGICDTRH